MEGIGKWSILASKIGKRSKVREGKGAPRNELACSHMPMDKLYLKSNDVKKTSKWCQKYLEGYVKARVQIFYWNS